jgi:CHAT domain-containing protein
VRTIDAGSEAVKMSVDRFRLAVAGRQLTYGQTARALYARFVKPVERRIKGAGTICIVPDGALWELPFPALEPKEGTFFLDQHAVFYAPSLTVLREMQSRAPQRSAGERNMRLLAFGNPTTSNAVRSELRDVYRGVSLGALPDSEEEVRSIAALYGPQNSSVHVRSDAREEVVKSEAGSFDVLHFATHGILDDQNAMYSRLLFSPPATRDEDGMLEAREIMGLHLHAYVAVLSACDTARGRVGSGEGSIGMAWALFVAGCPTSVVSRWAVNSASTTKLMIAFHRNLRRGGRKAEALRQAALDVRKHPLYRHPIYWAAFVIIGDGS